MKTQFVHYSHGLHINMYVYTCIHLFQSKYTMKYGVTAYGSLLQTSGKLAHNFLQCPPAILSQMCMLPYPTFCEFQGLQLRSSIYWRFLLPIETCPHGFYSLHFKIFLLFKIYLFSPNQYSKCFGSHIHQHNKKIMFKPMHMPKLGSNKVILCFFVLIIIFISIQCHDIYIFRFFLGVDNLVLKLTPSIETPSIEVLVF